MATAKELYDAAMLLKENCNISEKCTQCQFFRPDGECAIAIASDTPPSYWPIKKPRRFTDEEVALAKAFKSIGAVEIRGCIEGTLVISENDTCLAALPLNVFKGISTITLPIDEIIKDGDEE